MTTKETKNFKTVEVVRERERESLNLSQLGSIKCANSANKSQDINSNKIAKNVSKISKKFAFSDINLYKTNNKKDRLACSRYEERINLPLDSLSFLWFQFIKRA